ncbi:hypothetical protein KJ359_011578 [Pestalotiopsis sp. 9143b]|nr:hypothetical protein KJ359_011578 [Pestalotiopsis sp. 9143b]
MVLLDLLNPSVVSSSASCTTACLALSHSGTVVPKQFSRAKEKLAAPTVGYDPDAKSYNYLFARRETPSSLKWTAVVDGAVSRVEREVEKLRHTMQTLEYDLASQLAGSDGVSSRLSSFATKIDDIERLTLDDARLARVEGGLEKANGLICVSMKELSGSLQDSSKEFRQQLQAVSVAEEKTSRNIDQLRAELRGQRNLADTTSSDIREQIRTTSQSLEGYNAEFRKEIDEARKALAVARNETSQSLEKYSQASRNDVVSVEKALATFRSQSLISLDEYSKEFRGDITAVKSSLSDVRGQALESSQSIERENKELRKDVDAARKAASKLQQELSLSLDRHAKELQNKVDGDLVSVREDTTRSLVKHKAEFRKDIAAVNEAISAVEAQSIHSMSQFNDELRQELTTAKKNISETADATKRSLQTTSEDLQKENDSIRKDLAQTQDELKSLRQKLEEAEQDSKQDRMVAQEYARGMSALKNELEELKETIARDREQRDSAPVVMPDDFESLARNLSDITVRVDQIRSVQLEVQFLRGRMQDLEAGSGAGTSDAASTVLIHGSENGDREISLRRRDSRKRGSYISLHGSSENEDNSLKRSSFISYASSDNGERDSRKRTSLTVPQRNNENGEREPLKRRSLTAPEGGHETVAERPITPRRDSRNTKRTSLNSVNENKDRPATPRRAESRKRTSLIHGGGGGGDDKARPTTPRRGDSHNTKRTSLLHSPRSTEISRPSPPRLTTHSEFDVKSSLLQPDRSHASKISKRPARRSLKKTPNENESPFSLNNL